MAHYVIGDVQGCLITLQRLLRQLDFNYGKDTVTFVGDLVNRGPDSLGTLRFIKSHADCMETVLGNHDLYLLSQSLKKHPQYKKKDTIAPIFQAKDQAILITWLRSQPLYLHYPPYLIVHAGVHPQWGWQELCNYGDELSMWLKGPHFPYLMSQMYGNTPNVHHKEMLAFDRLRFSINVFTRMRMVHLHDYGLDFDFKGQLSQLPKGLLPWFVIDNPGLQGMHVLFGHWSALGLYQTNKVTALDTGVVWGGKLTAYNMKTSKITSVASELHR